MAEKNNIIFREVQQFRQAWLWVIIIFLASFSLYAAPLILRVIFGIALPIFFYLLKLTTEVRSDGLYIRFFPLHFSFRRIPLGELKRYEVRIYRPIREYGGWGIRYGFKGKAYNVSGNRGVQLELLKGKRLLIGSQRSEELANAIGLALRKHKED